MTTSWQHREAGAWFPETGRRIRLVGMPIDVVTEIQAIRRILQAVGRGKGGWVITPNLDHLRQFVQEPSLRALYEQANLVLADGMPLVWASRLRGTPLPERVPGSSLIISLTMAAAEQGYRVFLLGGNPGAATAAAQELRRLAPQLAVAGTLSPPPGFEHQPRELQRIRQALGASAPHIVYVALGFPKQERLIALLRPEFPGMWFLGVGISFSFVARQIQRAPLWMQLIGLEWVHRLWQEPRRLFARYVIHDLPFGAQLLAWTLMARWRGWGP